MKYDMRMSFVLLLRIFSVSLLNFEHVHFDVLRPCVNRPTAHNRAQNVSSLLCLISFSVVNSIRIYTFFGLFFSLPEKRMPDCRDQHDRDVRASLLFVSARSFCVYVDATVA